MRQIFISCGQRTDSEKQLTDKISDLITKLTPFNPYSAAQQTTVEGLTSHILQALNKSVGLIVVLHGRGNVTPPGKFIRASVWVEQEIAIAAFISQALGRKFPVQAFIEPSVHLEGMREQLLLNPKPFTTDDDVLDHLKIVLPTWVSPEDLEVPMPRLTQAQKESEASIAIVIPVADKPVPDKADVSLDIFINYEEINIQSERHDYRLIVSLNNQSNDIIDNFAVECRFPATICESHTNDSYYVPSQSDASWAVFRATSEQLSEPVFPGDIVRILTVDYFIDTDIFMNRGGLFQQEAIVSIYINGMKKTVTKPIAQLQIF